jgi:hypothetical protein
LKGRRRIITVTSSLNEISTDQLGKRVVGGGGVTQHASPLCAASFWKDIYLKDDVNDFPSISRILVFRADKQYWNF